MWTLAWWWMLALLPAPWFVRRFVRPRPLDNDSALKVPPADQFAQLGGSGGAPRSPSWRLAVLWTVWCLAVLAAARPQYLGDPVSLPVSGRDLLLAVDLSGSMQEQDFQLDGHWVDRLTATKTVASNFIDHRVGDRIGLILFGREAYLQTPLTFDRKTVKTLLNEAVIGLAGKETAIGDAIGLAIRTLQDAGVKKGRRVLILMTDGANTAGNVDPLKAAELAAQRKMIIYTIGIGADSMKVHSLFGVRQVNASSDLDEATLRKIANITGGRYFRARDTKDLAKIYTILDKLEPVKGKESGFRPVTELFYWPLGLALILAAAAVVLGTFARPDWLAPLRAREGHG